MVFIKKKAFRLVFSAHNLRRYHSFCSGDSDRSWRAEDRKNTAEFQGGLKIPSKVGDFYFDTFESATYFGMFKPTTA
jgi:hypothetical protein